MAVKKKVQSKKKTAPKKKVVTKKKAAPKKKKPPMGRPTAYKKEYGHIARILCEHGATDEGLAQAFKVTERTINTWKKSHPKDFLQPIKTGKVEADSHVRSALYHRACGYSHVDTKFASFEGVITDREEYTKHYPPDTSACVFWLCNRDGENWKRNGEEGGGLDATAALAEAFLKLSQVLPT